MKNTIIILLIAFFSTNPSQAATDLFGEFSVGNDNSRIAATNVTGPHENGASNSLMLSARAGYVYRIFLLGVEIQGSAGYLTYDLAQVKNGYWNKAFTYIFAGLDFGIIRLWGDYGVINQMRLALDYATYVTDKIYSGGTSYKVGVGLALSKRIHINAEYYVNSPDKMQNNTGQVNWNSTYSKWQETGYLFSVSYNLFGSEISTQR